MIEIDGSIGEGGGQVLRTALGLACLFRKPFTICNIRKNRRRPGLMPQHLACVKAAAAISGAVVQGDSLGSSQVSFSPMEVRAGAYSFDIGTAGSTSLLLQTLIPSLLFTAKATSLTLTGGTHVPFSPPFDFLAHVFVPLLERLGVRIRLSIETYGFYPKGGGRIRADILPADRLKPLDLTHRGFITGIHGHSGVGGLPLSIAARQRSAALARISLASQILAARTTIETLDVPSLGQGTFVCLTCRSENAVAGFSALGAKGKRAEAVGEEAAATLVSYHTSGAALDKHAADQIVPYLALSQGESRFTTEEVTSHLLTNLQVISLFHPIRYSVEGPVGKPGTVKIFPPD